MPATYQGTQFRTAGSPIIDLRPPAGTNRQRQREQLDLLAALNGKHREARPAESELQRIESYELAFRMQQHAPEAVDLTQESPGTQQLYGIDQPQTSHFGKQCLMARRLVERGVRFVQIYSGGGHSDRDGCGTAM